MIAITCTTIICVTVLLCVEKLAKVYVGLHPAQQLSTPSITEEELKKAYEDPEHVPDFQDVIETINKEFVRILEEDDGR